MRDDAVSDVDREIIAWIARASLRHEEKVPGPVVRRAGLCARYEGDQATRGYRRCEKLFHCVLQSVLVNEAAFLHRHAKAFVRCPLPSVARTVGIEEDPDRTGRELP